MLPAAHLAEQGYAAGCIFYTIFQEAGAMDLAEKLEILADSAKYDVACTSSGVDRPGRHGALGSSAAAGICHAHGGRAVRLPPEGALLQRVQLRLQLLRQPPLQRQTPRDLHPA